MERMVSAVPCVDYAPEHLKEVIATHFAALGGVEKYVQPGTRVLLKVNLLMARRPDTATTTHPAFVQALVEHIIAAGGNVIIADSPGGPFSASLLKTVYRVTGMEAVAAATGATLSYQTEAMEKKLPEGRMCKSFRFIKPYFEADLVISVAKLKTHSMTSYTGAVKNMFGLIPGLEKSEFHFRFPNRLDYCSMIVDMCTAAAPHLSFMDGIVAMEGNGPSGGEPFAAGLTFASKNPHALDLVATHCIGFRPQEVPTLAEAITRGLCPTEANQIIVTGPPLATMDRSEFKKPQSHSVSFLQILPPKLQNRLEEALAPKPAIDKAKCIGCGDCAESCPAKTIAIENKKASINYKNCIKCFCCQEMCPVKAIRIKKPRFFKM